MQAIILPPNITGVSLSLPKTFVKAEVEPHNKNKRLIWFETSRQGSIDGENEDIAADALWASRSLFLKRGNIDYAHQAWLSTPHNPDYVIGQPLEVKRNKNSIFVKAELSRSLTEPSPANITLADKIWSDMTEISPPKRYFPSVYGIFSQKNVRREMRKGKWINFITGPLQWLSVGLAMKAQNQALPPVSTTPLKAFVKAATPPSNILSMTWTGFQRNLAFTKAVTSGSPNALDAKTSLQGSAAIRPENFEQDNLFRTIAPMVLHDVRTKLVKCNLEEIAKAFCDYGASLQQGQIFAKRMLELAAKVM